MWGGPPGRGSGHPGEDDQGFPPGHPHHNSLAASALAAYTLDASANAAAFASAYDTAGASGPAPGGPPGAYGGYYVDQMDAQQAAMAAQHFQSHQQQAQMEMMQQEELERVRMADLDRARQMEMMEAALRQQRELDEIEYARQQQQQHAQRHYEDVAAMAQRGQADEAMEAMRAAEQMEQRLEEAEQQQQLQAEIQAAEFVQQHAQAAAFQEETLDQVRRSLQAADAYEAIQTAVEQAAYDEGVQVVTAAVAAAAASQQGQEQSEQMDEASATEGVGAAGDAPQIEIIEERRHDSYQPKQKPRQQSSSSTSTAAKQRQPGQSVVAASQTKKQRDINDIDGDTDEEDEAAPPAAPVVVAAAPTPTVGKTLLQPNLADSGEESDDSDSDVPSTKPASTPTPPPIAKKKPTPSSKSEGKKPSSTKKSSSAKKTPTKKDTETKKSPASSSKNKKSSSTPKSKGKKMTLPTSSALKAKSSMPSIDDPVPEITDGEYENVQALMVQFCKTPLLAEFSRPVALLHPELMPIYSKIVKHPIDLGRVCRSIRRRLYRNTRAIRLDMWRIFANCVKFHTDPHNRDSAIPSFVSIALHLRTYFNALWQEYMIPSDSPPASTGGAKSKASQLRAAYDRREEARKARFNLTSSTILSTKCIERVASSIHEFIESGGKVDVLDEQQVLNIEDDDVHTFVQSLKVLKSRLLEIVSSNEEYTLEELRRSMRDCVLANDLFEEQPSIRTKILARIDRLLQKVIVPIYEVNCRGVNQSSIWGCMAAAIWARESSKKPFWPALVLGILAPDDQKEDWHHALTERNEGRLPEKLATELQAGKRKAEQALRRQSAGGFEQMSYFLVEFMGSHEFIWVREADIIENFDPDEDPNQNSAVGSHGNVTKKKRGAHRLGTSASNQRMFASALDEGRWALEEFEQQLNDTCGDLSDEDDEEEGGYSYDILCQSDDEADGDATDTDNEIDGRRGTDDEETNELLATEGLLDFSASGRKNAKKRAAALKKQKADAKRAAQKREKEEKIKRDKQAKIEQQQKKKHELDVAKKAKENKLAKSKKAREKEKKEKREQRELEQRRNKRERERERVLREEERKAKRRKLGSPGNGANARGKRKAIPDKPDRAAAIVRGYLSRVAKKENLKGLGFGGVMTLPAAGIDSTGLLGMALAFRAAAGVLTSKDINDRHDGLKPWDRIDTDSPKTSSERCRKLEDKIRLLEKELKKLGEDEKRRQVLIMKAEHQKEVNEKKISLAEKKARISDVALRKKSPKKSAESKNAQAKKKSINDADNEKKEDGQNIVLDREASAERGNKAKEISQIKKPLLQPNGNASTVPQEGDNTDSESDDDDDGVDEGGEPSSTNKTTQKKATVAEEEDIDSDSGSEKDEEDDEESVARTDDAEQDDSDGQFSDADELD